MMRRGDDAGYDRSLTMFSPEGRLYQVEYALEAVRRGTLVIALKSKYGATLVTRKKFTKLMDSSTIEKIFQMDEHMGCAIAGLHADSRILVDYARVQCQVHRLTYSEPVRIQTITRKLADIKQQYSQHGGVRPFGSSLLIVGVDPDGMPRITTTSPSGTYWSWRGTAMGRNSDAARETLNKELNDEMSLEELVKLGIKILKESTDEEFEDENLSIATISAEERKFELLKYDRIKAYL
ncbi:Proteasome subunit alpha [Candidatus Lokiarchaeum ossiferum]|uniref:Proteasome subunit alpha n=1 Tax=Candidatus Lokiarchaeum ossiferum TaxID=2951803 RepID=A0ABY6HTK3_9ARCH|nr:Proteasome subunit alpha [Candidatus Lokiarchaeum sp. B-35]